MKRWYIDFGSESEQYSLVEMSAKTKSAVFNPLDNDLLQVEIVFTKRFDFARAKAGIVIQCIGGPTECDYRKFKAQIVFK